MIGLLRQATSGSDAVSGAIGGAAIVGGLTIGSLGIRGAAMAAADPIPLEAR